MPSPPLALYWELMVFLSLPTPNCSIRFTCATSFILIAFIHYLILLFNHFMDFFLASSYGPYFLAFVLTYKYIIKHVVVEDENSGRSRSESGQVRGKGMAEVGTGNTRFSLNRETQNVIVQTWAVSALTEGATGEVLSDSVSTLGLPRGELRHWSPYLKEGRAVSH